MFGDLNLKHFDFLVFLQDLGVERFMISGLIHPVSQLLNLLLLLRKLNLRCADHRCKATSFKRTCSSQIGCRAINLGGIHDGLTDATLANLVIFDSLSYLGFINSKCLLFQELRI